MFEGFVSLPLVSCFVGQLFALRPDDFLDTGADKKKLCLSLGAEKWIDFKETKDLTKSVLEMTDGLGAHAAVIAASTVRGNSCSVVSTHILQSESYAKAIDYLRPGGTLMVVGLPGSAKLEASIFFTVLKVCFLKFLPRPSLMSYSQGISILGSYVGNRQDTIEALDISARGKVRVVFQLRSLDALEE
jgi:propanol-preferring alcohol dehydrogenase